MGPKFKYPKKKNRKAQAVTTVCATAGAIAGGLAAGPVAVVAFGTWLVVGKITKR